MNMAIKWEAKEDLIKTDSATLFSWLSTINKGHKKLAVSGNSEMLVKRRVGLLSEVLSEYGTRWNVELVRSERNIADSITRGGTDEIVQRHSFHHRGINTPLHFAKETCRNVPLETVKEVVKRFNECNSIDPVPKKRKGDLYQWI
uniref:Uncharacterized protein n=1 Tax=Lepeophtheirus salmonis TaxID=72036 RepID=A0A0K2T1V3_LEPSM